MSKPAKSPERARYIFFSDAAVFSSGYGCQVLAFRLCEFLAERIATVVSRPMPKGADGAQLHYDVRTIPDLSRHRVPCRPVLEVVAFLLWLLCQLPHIRRSRADRLFVLSGSDGWFLAKVIVASALINLPVDMYLVDDFEATALLRGRRRLGLLFRIMERVVLHRASRVFAISAGYCEHLNRKYGVVAEWLPIPVEQDGMKHNRCSTEDGGFRSIVFVGAINSLYISPLRELLTLLQEWNSKRPSDRLRLELLTYTDPDYVRAQFPASPYLLIRHNLSEQQLRARAKRGWALFIPYAFTDDVRILVSTSFPSKLSEAYLSGRPIIVYGPEYASLPRYFRSNGLALCVSSLDELRSALWKLTEIDDEEIVGAYQGVVAALHSPKAIVDKICRAS